MQRKTVPRMSHPNEYIYNTTTALKDRETQRSRKICCEAVTSRNDKEASPIRPQQHSFLNKTTRGALMWTEGHLT